MFLSSVLKRTRTIRTSLKTKRFLSYQNIPDHAHVVVIGGGIIGNSVAYHLAQAGIEDVVVLEQQRLTSGTTWHAAGLMVTFGSTSETFTEIRKYSRKLYSELEEETGLSTGFKPVGFIELATDTDRLEEYRRVAAFNRKHGVDVHEISPREVKDLFPLCHTEDLIAGFYVKEDGRVNPIDATMALAKGARMKGARICEGVRVERVTEEIRAGTRWVSGVQVSSASVEVAEASSNYGYSGIGSAKTITADYVVNCAGMWARQLGEKNGVTIANQAAEHYYVVTETMPEVDPGWPVIEDPSSYTYIRPEGGGLMLGMFESRASAWNTAAVPSRFEFGEITPDLERMAPFVEQAMRRVPAAQNAGLKTFFCGPESFTPDLLPCVGEAPEIRNYFVAAGMNSIGILSGGGIGRVLAHWIANSKPDVDVTGFHINRLQRYQSNPAYRAERVVESLSNVYKVHYPFKTPSSARGAKRSPFYDRLKARGANFRAVSGFETADWYDCPTSMHSVVNEDAPTDANIKRSTDVADENDDSNMLSADEIVAADRASVAADPRQSWGQPEFFPQWAREHAACREGVGLMDMSFMSKFLVQGRDAGACLNRLCTADVDGAVDTITYTQCLNEDGCVEADITVCKLSFDKFLVIATDTMHRHVEAHLQRNLDPSASKHVLCTDVTGAFAQLNLQGPRSRELLRLLTDTDMGDAQFPFRTAREVAIGLARVRVARITYVGELGYELHVPVEFALHVYEQVLLAGQHLPVTAEPGREVGLVHCGLKALGSLRLEKGYRDYGHDMDNLDSLLEVGLGFTADYNKEGGFVGKEAVLRQKEELKVNKGLARRLVHVKLGAHESGDRVGFPMLHHAEVVWRDGRRVGEVRAGSYGHTLGSPVGLAMIELGEAGKVGEVGEVEEATVDKDTNSIASEQPQQRVINKKYLEEGKWQVEIAGGLYSAELSLRPFYDPLNLRIKA